MPMVRLPTRLLRAAPASERKSSIAAKKPLGGLKDHLTLLRQPESRPPTFAEPHFQALLQRRQRAY